MVDETVVQPSFIHLRVHTEYSLIDGIVRVKPFIKRLADLGMPAAAVSDQSNLFALVKFYRNASAAGIKAIAGADFYLFNTARPSNPYCISLLAQDSTGYANLIKLVSLGYQKCQRQGLAMLTDQWLKRYNRGLIALSGAHEGELGQHLLRNKGTQARTVLERWLKVFDQRFFLEIQRIGVGGEEHYIQKIVDLAIEFDAPLVATNNVRFLYPEDFEAHEARICIHQGRILDDPRRPRLYTNQQYLRSQEEMHALFSDIPEALENTVEIAKRCTLELTLGKTFLPDFPLPDEMNTEDYFVQQSQEGLENRLRKLTSADSELPQSTYDEYRHRLGVEMAVILKMGFAGYFLIVADFIRWAKQSAIPVGPGRGSGAGSLVAYALNITDLDPIEFDLLFERFLNPERVSMPDFDIDFCMERRDQVIDYVAHRYGREKVSQIITYGSMAARAVVRDVGRVLGHPYGFVDKLAKLIPFEIGMTLEKALTDSKELREQCEKEDETRQLLELARSLEGIVRNPGKHAGGVVIAPSNLTNFTPLYCEADGANLVTQFDKDDVEAVGLVKFDFLGLRTLTIIDWAVQAINSLRKEKGEPPLVIDRLPRNDETTYALLKTCSTTAVFQLESRGMKDLVRRLQPDCFEDIIALVALFRPGPLQSGMVDDYINVKHSKARAEYPHPVLEPILKPTNGVILYQEQVMQIARELAGYSLGGADLLRRAMGKKKAEEMAKQRAIFTKGAIRQGVDEKVASYIFDLMEKFAGYGFNKSHSAAYALIAYQTAWLKAHYPAGFMAAVLSSDMDNTDKVVNLIDECRSMKLAVLPPDVNRSEFKFTVQKESEIFYGLGAIKGIGRSAIEELIEQRCNGGDYADLLDLCRRVDLRKINRRVLEALIRAGALDVFGQHRALLIEQLPVTLQTAEQHGLMLETGQDDLFGLSAKTLSSCREKPECASIDRGTRAWSEKERLQAEKATLGLYLTGHPMDEYKNDLRGMVTGNISSLIGDGESTANSASVRVAGLVMDLRMRQTKQGKRMGFAILDDRSARIEMAVFTDVYEQYGSFLVQDNLLVAEGVLGIDDYSGHYRLTADRLFSIEQARTHFARNLVINWNTRQKISANANEKNEKKGFVDILHEVIAPYCGGSCPILINYVGGNVQIHLRLGDVWRIRPEDDLINRLTEYLGADGFRINYH